MKKSFWGYDPSEVDDLVDSLQSQNDILTAKLTGMSMELAAKSEVTAIPDPDAEKHFQEMADLRRQNSSLEEEINALKSELINAREEANAAKADAQAAIVEVAASKEKILKIKEGILKAQEAQEAQQGFESREVEPIIKYVQVPQQPVRSESSSVGQMFQNVYNDMITIKSNAVDEVEKYVGDVTAATDGASTSMQNTLKTIRSAQEAAAAAFVQAAEAILENFDTLCCQNDELARLVKPIEEIGPSLAEKVGELTEKFVGIKNVGNSEEESAPIVEEQAPVIENVEPKIETRLSKAIASLKTMLEAEAPVVQEPIIEVALKTEEAAQPAAEIAAQAAVEAPANKFHIIDINSKVKADDILHRYSGN